MRLRGAAAAAAAAGEQLVRHSLFVIQSGARELACKHFLSFFGAAVIACMCRYELRS